MAKLDVKAVGLAFGIMWGMAMFLLGIMAMFLDRGTVLLEAISSLYIGFNPTWLGSVTGGFWGLVDGGIGGLVFAWLYNKLAK